MYLARLAVVLGRLDDANDLFERTDARLLALGAPFFQARNQVEWARLLSMRGSADDARRARELLTEAAATAEQYGCAGIERRAKQLVAVVA
jgi:hypothetical protein